MPCGAQMVHRHGPSPHGGDDEPDLRGRTRARLVGLAVVAAVIALLRVLFA